MKSVSLRHADFGLLPKSPGSVNVNDILFMDETQSFSVLIFVWYKSFNLKNTYKIQLIRRQMV